MLFGFRDHRGSLEKSLKTINFISRFEFLSSLDSYEFYSFDNRCNQLLFCLKDFNLSKPFWLFIQF